MATNNIFPTKIIPLTGGEEVVVAAEEGEASARRLDCTVREDESKLRAHYLLMRGQDTTSHTDPTLRNVAGAPPVVDGSFANGMQAQSQLMERIANLEAELTRTRQEIAQLKEMNTMLQQGIPDVIRRTLRDELRKPRWSVLNSSDSTFQQSSASSQRQRVGSSSAQKRHKGGPTPRAVLKARDTPTKMTKKLLTTFFDRETLATSTLTGKGGKSKTLTKAQLDPSVVKTVVDKVTETFGISECLVRNVISQKCKEEMMNRRRRLGLDAKSGTIKTTTG